MVCFCKKKIRMPEHSGISTLSSLIRTVPSAQESHLFGSFEFAGFHRRYGIAPFPKDTFFENGTETCVSVPDKLL